MNNTIIANEVAIKHGFLEGSAGFKEATEIFIDGFNYTVLKGKGLDDKIDLIAKKVAKVYGFIEGQKGFVTAVKIFKYGVKYVPEKELVTS